MNKCMSRSLICILSKMVIIKKRVEQRMLELLYGTGVGVGAVLSPMMDSWVCWSCPSWEMMLETDGMGPCGSCLHCWC